MLIKALEVVFAFALLVMVHEFGHYIVARLNGIRVLEFAFGFGPKIVGFSSKGTDYSWRLVPLGGFVRLYGMDPETNENGEQVIAPSNDPHSFMNKKVWQRMAVIAAGAIMNFVLAMALFVLVFAYYGIPSSGNGNTIGSLIAGKPAEKAGIQPGTKIVSIEGKPTTDWNSLTEAIHSRPNQKIILTIEQNGTRKDISITTEKDPSTGFGMIGIAPEIIYEHASLFQATRYGLERTVEFTRFIMVTLVQMITGQIPADVGGPIAIAQAIDDVAQQGWENYLAFIGILSIQLGLINLFPIPALDGSRLVFLFVEGLRGKPLNPERENFIHLVGFVLLLALMVAITYQDIVKLFTNKG